MGVNSVARFLAKYAKYREVRQDQNEPGGLARLQKTIEVARHGFEVVGHEDAVQIRGQPQNIWVLHRIGNVSLRRQEFNRRFPLAQSANDREAEIRVCQEGRSQTGLRSLVFR